MTSGRLRRICCARRFGELVNHYLNHQLPRLSKSARKANKSYIKNWIESKRHDHLAGSMKTMQIQEWRDRNSTPGWNQAEDQERAVRDLLPRSPLGIGGSQPCLQPRREFGPSWCFDRRSSKKQSLNPACHSCSRRRSSNSGATAATRGNYGARRCSHGSPRVGVSRPEVEACREGDRNPLVRVRVGRRRTEGNEEQEQSAAPGGARPASTSSLARAHSLSLGRRLDWPLSRPVMPAEPHSNVSLLVQQRSKRPVGWHRPSHVEFFRRFTTVPYWRPLNIAHF
jgi:hypothetical protein